MCGVPPLAVAERSARDVLACHTYTADAQIDMGPGGVLHGSGSVSESDLECFG